MEDADEVLQESRLNVVKFCRLNSLTNGSSRTLVQKIVEGARTLQRSRKRARPEGRRRKRGLPPPCPLVHFATRGFGRSGASEAAAARTDAPALEAALAEWHRLSGGQRYVLPAVHLGAAATPALDTLAGSFRLFQTVPG